MLEVRFNQQISMDARGRVSVPSRLKSALEFQRIHSLVFIVHGDRLRGYTPKDFSERVEAPLLANDAFDPYEDEKQLLRLGSANELDIDSQGRFVIPSELRQMAGLGDKLVMISMADRLEIWDQSRFQAAWDRAHKRRDTLGGVGG
jgi:MraZ protein